jgi:RNA polymerase sigma factor (sigma-70 family)
MTESQLIEACKRNDSFAQRLLYEQYADKLFVVCLRYVSNKADAEELLSDCFVKAFKHAPSFQFIGAGSLGAWLRKIAVNECLMFLRKKKQLIIPIDEHPVAAAWMHEASALQHMNVAAILQSIQKLPTGYRTVFNLFVFEERSHKEIAEALGISENTSKSQLFKARHMLKTLLDDPIQKSILK